MADAVSALPFITRGGKNSRARERRSQEISKIENLELEILKKTYIIITN